jgi:hypothetical protein
MYNFLVWFTFSMILYEANGLEIPTTVKFNTVSFKPIEHRLICKSNIQFVQIHFQPKQNQFWSRICIHIVVEPKANWFLSPAIFQSVDDAPYNLVLLASYWSQYLQIAFMSIIPYKKSCDEISSCDQVLVASSTVIINFNFVSDISLTG